MKLFFKIILIIYYFLVTIFIFLQVISIDGTANGTPFFYSKTIAIINNVFYVILLIIGLSNLGKKHIKWLPKKIILGIIVSFILWIIIVFYFLYKEGVLEYDYTLKVTIAILPCLVHVFWHYINFENDVYSFKAIDNGKLISYAQILDLDLSYLKVLENNQENLHIRLSVPYNFPFLFVAIFTLFWVSVWTFGATMLFLEYPWAIFFYLPSILVLYVLWRSVFTKIDLIITPLKVKIIQSPSNKTVLVNDLNDLMMVVIEKRARPIYLTDLKNINFQQYRFFGHHIILTELSNHKRFRFWLGNDNREMLFTIIRLLKVHLYLKSTKS